MKSKNRNLLQPTTYNLQPYRRGFTLVETLVGAVVLSILAVAVYQSYAVVIAATIASRAKIAATLLANEQIEIIRNLSYPQVGTIGGTPAGVVFPEQTLVRDGIAFGVQTIIAAVDDPYDGIAPVDNAPSDYKLVEVIISCTRCRDFSPTRFATLVAP